MTQRTAYYREYYKKNKDSILERQKKWRAEDYKSNPEKYRNYFKKAINKDKYLQSKAWSKHSFGKYADAHQIYLQLITELKMRGVKINP